MSKYNIHLKIDNPILTRLMEEQFSFSKEISASLSLPADCIIIEQGNESKIPEGIAFLKILKGAVRIGEIMDKLGYILSDRESHLECNDINLDLGDYILFPAENILMIKETSLEIKLTDKDRLLLRVLYEAEENGMSRSDLLHSIWGYSKETETHTVETHIYRLRKKLEEHSISQLVLIENGNYFLNIKKPA